MKYLILIGLDIDKDFFLSCLIDIRMNLDVFVINFTNDDIKVLV